MADHHYFAHDLSNAVKMAAWPTPKVTDIAQERFEVKMARNDRLRSEGKMKGCGSPLLLTMASLAAWATPTTRDHKDGESEGTAPVNALLGRQAWLAGWKTPTAGCVGKGGAQNPEKRMEGGHVVDLQDQATLASWPAVPDAMDAALHLNLVPDLLSLMDSGATQVGFYADRSGVVVIPVGGPLNPEHSRWLMGYRAEVGSCGATAMQSIRTSRRGSSKRTAKRAE
jgi:hypothetical protein